MLCVPAAGLAGGKPWRGRGAAPPTLFTSSAEALPASASRTGGQEEVGEAAPHLCLPQLLRRRLPPWHRDGETIQEPIPGRRNSPRLRNTLLTHSLPAPDPHLPPNHSPPRSPAPASGRSPTAPSPAPGPCSAPSHPGALCLTFSGSEGFLTICIVKP